MKAPSPDDISALLELHSWLSRGTDDERVVHVDREHPKDPVSGEPDASQPKLWRVFLTHSGPRGKDDDWFHHDVVGAGRTFAEAVRDAGRRYEQAEARRRDERRQRAQESAAAEADIERRARAFLGGLAEALDVPRPVMEKCLDHAAELMRQPPERGSE